MSSAENATTADLAGSDYLTHYLTTDIDAACGTDGVVVMTTKPERVTCPACLNYLKDS